MSTPMLSYPPMATSLPQTISTIHPFNDSSQPIHHPELSTSYRIDANNDISYMDIQFQYLGKPDNYNVFQVFIATDEKVGIGYMINGIDADYMLENGSFNKYIGENGEWVWERIQTDVTFTNENNIAYWNFPKNEVPFSDIANFVFQLIDKNLNIYFTSQVLHFVPVH